MQNKTEIRLHIFNLQTINNELKQRMCMLRRLYLQNTKKN